MAEENKERDPFEGINLDAFNDMSSYLMSKGDLEIEEEEEQEKETNEEDIDPVTGLPKEKQVEESEEEKEKSEASSSQETSKDSSRLTPYFKLLVEEGAFTEEDFEKWDGTTAGMLNLRHEKELQAWEQYKNEALDPRTKWLQDNLEAGVPFDELLRMDRESLSIEGITEEALEDNEDLQKNVAKMYYSKTTKFSEANIDKAIKRLADSGELKDEAKSFIKELGSINEYEKAQALEAARKEQENAQRAEQEMLANLKKAVTDTQEIIPGLKITNLMKDKIYNTLTTATSQDDNGALLNRIAEERARDPLGFEVKLTYLFELTNGFKDFSTLTSSGRKNAYKDFEKAASEIDRSKEHASKSYNPNDAQFLSELEDLHKKGFFG